MKPLNVTLVSGVNFPLLQWRKKLTLIKRVTLRCTCSWLTKAHSQVMSNNVLLGLAILKSYLFIYFVSLLTCWAGFFWVLQGYNYGIFYKHLPIRHTERPDHFFFFLFLKLQWISQHRLPEKVIILCLIGGKKDRMGDLLQMEAITGAVMKWKNNIIMSRNKDMKSCLSVTNTWPVIRLTCTAAACSLSLFCQAE